MSPNDPSVNTDSLYFSQDVDLNLEIPSGFEASSLFKEDRMLRLHPNWFIQEFSLEEANFTARLKDYATEKKFSLSGRIDCQPKDDQLIHLQLDQGIVTRIIFYTKNNTLWVRVSAPEEVPADDPLLLWIRAIREYLRIYVKNSVVNLFWRMVMNRIILTMNPSQRKICLMLFRFTLLEIFVIILIVVGYFIFVL